MVEKICADADAAYEKVDASYGGEYFGRVDKGACLGLKAIVRWMAATPLWNGGTLPNDTRAFKDEYTTYDPKTLGSSSRCSKRCIGSERCQWSYSV